MTPARRGRPVRRARALQLQLLLFLAGLAALVALVWMQGTGEVVGALATIGWGLLPIAAYRAVPLAVHTLGWRVVVTWPARPGTGSMLWMRWVAESVNSLLPVAQVGGELLRARLLARAGPPGPSAGASVLVDFTLGLLTQAVFTIAGVLLLIAAAGTGERALTIAAAVLAATVPVLLFLLLQQRGALRLLARLVDRLTHGPTWARIVGDTHRLDRLVRGLYARRRLMGTAAALRLAGWLLGTGEVYLVFLLLGHPLDLATCMVLESLAWAARSAGFAIPGALGVQEGGVVLVGLLLGIDPALALTLSLTKRLREIVVGVPLILSWLWREGADRRIAPPDQPGRDARPRARD